MDLSVLLVAQGEMVDQIALHVTNAVDDTEEGVKELAQAVKLQKRTRKVSACNLPIENVLYHWWSYCYRCHYWAYCIFYKKIVAQLSP